MNEVFMNDENKVIVEFCYGRKQIFLVVAPSICNVTFE